MTAEPRVSVANLSGEAVSALIDTLRGEGRRNVMDYDAFTTEKKNLAWGRPWAVPEWLYYQASIEGARFLFGIDPRPERPIDDRTGGSGPSQQGIGPATHIAIASMARITEEGRGLCGPSLKALIEEVLVPLGRETGRRFLSASFNAGSERAFKSVTEPRPRGIQNAKLHPRGRIWWAEVEP